MTTADPTYEYQHDDEGSIRECWSCNMRAPVSTFGIRDGNAVVRDRLLCEFCARTSITHASPPNCPTRCGNPTSPTSVWMMAATPR